MPDNLGIDELLAQLTAVPDTPDLSVDSADNLPPSAGGMPGVSSGNTGTPSGIPGDLLGDLGTPDFLSPGNVSKSPQGGMPSSSVPGSGIPVSMRKNGSVSLEDTLKSNVGGNAPALGSSMNPLGDMDLDDLMNDQSSLNLGSTTTVQTVEEEIPNPYAFPMENAGQETPDTVQETVDGTKKIIGIIAISIIAFIALFAVVMAVNRQIKKYTAENNPGTSQQETQQGNPQGNQQGGLVPAENPGGNPQGNAGMNQGGTDSVYTGPKIKTAEPNAIAISDTVFDDVMAINKQIQVENGTVECYFVGTPKHFGQKIKIPVSVQEYNKANQVDIVNIRYSIVRISGVDYVIDPYVVYKEGE